MSSEFLDAPGELFLGSDPITAMAQGPRHFRTAIGAIRFAMEHAAPVSLRGARLLTGGKTLLAPEIRRLHVLLTAAGANSMAATAVA